MTLFFCWTSRFQVLQGMFVQSFAQMFEELLRRTNIKSNLTPNIEYTPKPSITMPSHDFCTCLLYTSDAADE